MLSLFISIVVKFSAGVSTGLNTDALFTETFPQPRSHSQSFSLSQSLREKPGNEVTFQPPTPPTDPAGSLPTVYHQTLHQFSQNLQTAALSNVQPIFLTGNYQKFPFTYSRLSHFSIITQDYDCFKAKVPFCK